jgi:hypothetical protein
MLSESFIPARLSVGILIFTHTIIPLLMNNLFNIRAVIFLLSIIVLIEALNRIKRGVQNFVLLANMYRATNIFSIALSLMGLIIIVVSIHSVFEYLVSTNLVYPTYILIIILALIMIYYLIRLAASFRELLRLR